MNSHFYAMLFRMKYIDRWALMRNTRKETLAEHTLETAFIAHALAVIHNKRFGGNVDPEKAAVLALFHDAPEIITGDLPTPVKYYNSDIKNIYKEIESAASDRLLELLPDDLRPEFEGLFNPTDPELCRIVKAADKLSALIKCRDELSLGNRDFSAAERSTLQSVKELDLPAANVFLEEFLDSFSLPLDEQK
ncbi:MAG: 5'-deoxynucleotidase [Clostridia bacterium]|nr:5'-deoxynucleotidase [Clostridia bacterium]